MKTISVVIPTFNRVKQLVCLLDSLDNQTLSSEHFEIFVVNDGSTDGTERMLKQRGILYITLPQSGPAVARNSGALHTSSELIAFIDDDAIASKGWLESAYKRYRGKESFLIAEGDVKSIGKDVPFSHTVDHSGPNGNLTCNLVVQREFFNNIGGFNKLFKYPRNEDYEFFLRVKKKVTPLYVKDMIVFHPVVKLDFFKTLINSYFFTKAFIESEYILMKLAPEEFASVKYADSAKDSIKRIAQRYLFSQVFKKWTLLLRYPIRGLKLFIVSLIRQVCFIYLYLTGYQGDALELNG